MNIQLSNAKASGFRVRVSKDFPHFRMLRNNQLKPENRGVSFCSLQFAQLNIMQEQELSLYEYRAETKRQHKLKTLDAKSNFISLFDPLDLNSRLKICLSHSKNDEERSIYYLHWFKGFTHQFFLHGEGVYG